MTDPIVSRRMSRVRARDTKPELSVRRALHAAGYRFRLHKTDLPGRPDIVLPRHRLVVFVNGCFWHQHRRCRLANVPSENQRYWLPKFERTRQRDRLAKRRLRSTGWGVEVIWECETEKGIRRVLDRLADAIEYKDSD